MDPCHVLVFLGQIDSHLHNLSQTEVHKDIGSQSTQHLLADLLFLSIWLLVVMKSLLFKVDLETSVVDPELTQMTIRYKHGGVIEELLG